ncbi:MAG: GNAT family N-acetyltransferase [Lachnospiraceae bacterium]|nr:GNAT family N-acetyltransferase [Lachnospiraceae bacterium]
MRYELISPESAGALKGFLPQEILDNPGFDRFFYYAAIGDDGGAVGVAAVDPAVSGPELLSIGVSTEFEGKGYGSALLAHICSDLFKRQEEERFISASANLPLSSWERIGSFLIKNNFVLYEDSPVYHVRLSDAADSQILKSASGRSPSGGFLRLKDVPDNKLRVFSHSVVNKGIFHSITKNGLDQDVSVFYMPEDEIRACALFTEGKGGVLQNTWVYLDPELTGGMTFALLLAKVAEYAMEKYSQDTVVSFITAEENSRELIRKILPDTEPVSEIRTYTKMLTGIDPLEGGKDDPRFEEFSERNMCCADCANSYGKMLECAIYSRKPDAVTDGESCLYFEEK